MTVNREWAAEQNWPISGYLPDDKSRGVYLLEAYHQLHCLVSENRVFEVLADIRQRIIRKTFWEAVDGLPFTHNPNAHMEHCFDALRQVSPHYQFR